MRSFEDGVTGFVVAPGDPAAMAGAVARSVEIADELGGAAHDRAVAVHALDVVAASWADCLADVTTT